MTGVAGASAIRAWNEQVEAHHRQTARRLQETGWISDDVWGSSASLFRAETARLDDSVCGRLAHGTDPCSTVLDVGGGAGRFALPLARHVRHVTVVEPSTSMAEALLDSARRAGISNIALTPARWEDAQVQPADMVLCAHVVYGVADIEPFIHKLTAHARDRVLVLAFEQAPLSQFADFWRAVYDEKRIALPGLPELVRVLGQMGILPDLEMLPTRRTEASVAKDAALEILRQFLYVKPGGTADKRLQAGMEQLTRPVPGGVALRNTTVQRQGLLSWRGQSL